MSQQLRKLLPFADAVFTLGGLLALYISQLAPDRPLFWAGFVMTIIGIIGAFQLRRISKERRREVMLDIAPDAWTVQVHGGAVVDAWLTITHDRHERGTDVGVRIEQIALKHWDLAEPKIDHGNITIRYARNNFPMNPRIPLRIYISGRG